MTERGGRSNDLYLYSGVGLQFAATIGLFALGGRWLDGKWGTSPWLLLVGVFTGFALGLVSMLSKLQGGSRSHAGRDDPKP